MEQDYSFYFGKMAEDFRETEWMRQMYIVFNGLNGTLKKDGNKWCATCGEWPEHDISGFGDTPQQAMNNWYVEYYNPKPNRIQIKRFSEPDDTDMIYWMDSDLIIKNKRK